MPVQKLPYALRATIVEKSRDRNRPRAHIAYSEKQIRAKGQQTLPRMVQRVDQQDRRKRGVVDQVRRQRLSGSDLALYKVSSAAARNHERLQRLQLQTHFIPMPPMIRREPNYYRFLSREFIQYLREHPYSKRVHVAFWRDSVLVFLTHGNYITAVNYTLPEHFMGSEEEALALVKQGNLSHHVVPLLQ